MSDHEHEWRPIPDTQECGCDCGARARDSWRSGVQRWTVTYDPVVEAKKVADREAERRALAKEFALRQTNPLAWAAPLLAKACVNAADALLDALDRPRTP